MSASDHDRRRGDVAAYLLGSLEPAEAADFERHLLTCVECRTELDWLRPSIQVLPESVEPLSPPPQLRSRILAEVGADSEGSAAAEAGGQAGSWRRLGANRGLRPLVGLAALALIAAAVGGYAIREGQSEPTSTVTAGRSPGVIARVVRDGSSATLRLANVRPLAPEKVLQAWVQRGGRVVSAHSLFEPDITGHASATLPNMQGVEAVMVTAEPRGGSPRPTSSPLVTVAIPQ